MRRWFSSTLVVLLTGFLTLAGVGPLEQAAATTTGTVSWSAVVGGSGGSATPTLSCGSGKVVVGVYTGGNDSQVFGFKCANLNADGSIGTSYTTTSFFALSGCSGSTDTSYGFA